MTPPKNTTPVPANLAVVVYRLDGIQTDICSIKALLKEIRDNQSILTTQSAVNSTNIVNIKDDVTELQKRSDRWDTINTMIGAVAAGLAVVFGSNK